MSNHHRSNPVMTPWRRVLPPLLSLALLGLTACAGGYAEQASYARSYDAAYGGEAAPGAAAPKMAMEAEESGGLLDGFFNDGDKLAYDEAPAPEPAPDVSKPEAPPVTIKTAPQGAPGDEAPSAQKTPEPPTQRIIIYTGELGLYVYEVDATLEQATKLTQEMGGWVQQSTSTSLMIRVPARNFEMIMAELVKLGDVSYKNVVGQDVTEEFYDLSIRLNNATVMRERYVELLKKATTVEDSLKIEQELGRITEEIERLKGRLKFLQQHASFSTITIQLSKKSDAPIRDTRVPLPFYWLQNYSLDELFY